MRQLLLVLPLLLGLAPATQAQVSVGIGVQLPGVSIGINLPAYPELERVPGHPVYYAPQAAGNYFFYDGLYWVYQGDDWYASDWYNGPWRQVRSYDVPVYILRVPVRYYRQPPPYFRGWRAEAPPRWGEHWGSDWARRRPGWDRWDRRAMPAPAPLPVYQRKYPQSRYPQEPGQQQAIRSENSRYRPRDPVARQHDPMPERAAPPRERAPPQQRPHAEPVERGRQPARAEPPGRGEERKDGREHNRENDRENKGKDDGPERPRENNGKGRGPG